MKKLIIAAAVLAPLSAFAQQMDTAKLAPIYQQQRNIAHDQVATCSVLASELQARIAELEKKLAEAQAAAAK